MDELIPWKKHETMEEIAQWLENRYMTDGKIRPTQAYAMCVNAYEIGLKSRSLPVVTMGDAATDKFVKMLEDAGGTIVSVERRSKKRGGHA